MLTAPAIDTTSLHGIASITQQTPWKCEFFDFGRAKTLGVDFFNPAICRVGEKLWLFTRRSIHNKGQLFGTNDIVAFELKGMKPAHGVRIPMERRFPGEQYEDPRVVVHGDRVFVSACDFVWQKGKWTGAHQIVSEVSLDFRQSKRYDPVYGFNGHNLGLNIGHEKNWLWFFHDGQPHLIYRACPHEVVPMSHGFQRIITREEGVAHGWPIGYKTNWDNSVWLYGEMRGGTNPILVGDEYYTFFHSSTEWIKPKRQYHMGSYVFDSKPPFRVKRITIEPLLSGSQKDRWFKGKPLVVFPCGSVFENNHFTVSMGVNDLDSAWIEIPKDDLDDQMIEV